MGSCISLHKTLNLNSPAKPRQWVGSKTAHRILIPMPTNNNNQENNVNHQHSIHQFLSQGNVTTFQDHSYKEDDAFFDSQVCLESDCEDFFSVDGDFTPSHGHSPIHDSSFIEVQLDSNVSIDRSSSLDHQMQISPGNGEKKLSEFLHKNLQKVDQVNVNPRGILKPEESNRVTRSHSCCVPSLPLSLSICEKKGGSTSMQTKARPFQKIRQASVFKKPFHSNWY